MLACPISPIWLLIWKRLREHRNEERAQFLAQKICHVGEDASQKLLDSWQTMTEPA